MFKKNLSDFNEVFLKSSLRSKVVFYKTLTLLLFIFLVFSWFAYFGSEKVSMAGNFSSYIARVNIECPIGVDKGVNELLDKVYSDDNVSALILNINSPGGIAPPAELIYNQLKKISSRKPVIAISQNQLTSAAYLIAAGADRILTQKMTVVGSIGARMRIINANKFADKVADKLGIEVYEFHSSKHKISEFSELDDENKKEIQEFTMDGFAIFKEIVSKERNLIGEDLEAVANAKVFHGIRALDLGLVDGIGGEEEAIAWLMKEKGVKETDRVRVLLPKACNNSGSFLNGIVGKIVGFYYWSQLAYYFLSGSTVYYT